MGKAILDLSKASRSEWLAARKIGSSDCAAILGLNPYKSRMQVYLEKVGAIETKDISEVEQINWGNILEPVIAGEFAKRTNLTIKKDTMLRESERYPFLTATLDYFVYENGKAGALEIKNTGFRAAQTWEEGIPDAAHCQLMHQFAVTGLDWGYVCALVGGNKLVWHKVERDDAILDRIIIVLSEFWQLVENKTPPEMTGADLELINELYPASSNKNIILSDDYSVLCSQIVAAKQQKKELEDYISDKEVKIKAAMQDAEKAIAGEYKISWKSGIQNRLDTELLKTEAPEVYSKFLKQVPTRRFLLTQNKEVKNGKE